MNDFRTKLYYFMQGRRGVDEFGRALGILALILILVNMFLRIRILSYAIDGLIIYQIFRMLSRNIPAREKENRWYMDLRYNRGRPKRNNTTTYETTGRSEPVYRYFLCPSCGLKMRAPAGKGRIKVKCSKCGKEFETLV